MCRWLAYAGPPSRIDSLLFPPRNSLIRQSLHATLGATTTNGDGFGLGWYGERGFPGLYRDTPPA
jgi:predicted glutamine amidotransferase